MPYRRLPKTDAARQRALKILLDNDSIYTARNKFVDWKLLSKAREVYDKFYTACEQHRLASLRRIRYGAKNTSLHYNAAMYASHFVQVLFMTVERREIKPQQLELYGLPTDKTAMPDLKTAEGLLEWVPRIVGGEKKRLKVGGRPIYNPTISMVATHFDIFKESYMRLKELTQKEEKAYADVRDMRVEADNVILDIWNQIEEHYKDATPEIRFAECRKLGVVYYYRRNEEHLY